MKVINCISKACPLPVIETRNALKKVDELETIVDNEIAVQNLEKLAFQLGAKFETIKDKDCLYHVHIQMGEAEERVAEEEVVEEKNQVKDERYNVIIGSNKMGKGNDELGQNLMQTFLFTLSQQDKLPENIIFYNSGVQLVTKDSPVLIELKNLAQAGVKIAACGVCLNYYGLTKEVAVGEITNMYRIVEAMHEFNRVIQL